MYRYHNIDENEDWGILIRYYLVIFFFKFNFFNINYFCRFTCVTLVVDFSRVTLEANVRFAIGQYVSFAARWYVKYAIGQYAVRW